MEIIEVLKNNDFVWLTLTICTLVSVPLAIYFGCKSLPRKTIRAIISDNELITNKQSDISKLKILYDDKSVDKLTVTKLTFWNGSLQTIHNTDIIAAAPLSIFAKNGKILEVSVLEGENTPNKINVSLADDTTANITFDYLDKSEGGIIQIIHTGDLKSIDITRKIKGGKIKLHRLLPQQLLLISWIGISIIVIINSTISLIPIIKSPYTRLLIEALTLIPGIIFTLICLWPPKNNEFIPKNCKQTCK